MNAAMVRLFRRIGQSDTEREIEEQLSFHLDLLTDELLRLEMSSEEARTAARERFGNVKRIKAQCLKEK